MILERFLEGFVLFIKFFVLIGLLLMLFGKLQHFFTSRGQAEALLFEEGNYIVLKDNLSVDDFASLGLVRKVDHLVVDNQLGSRPFILLVFFNQEAFDTIVQVIALHLQKSQVSVVVFVIEKYILEDQRFCNLA